jgi:hypothetical protein
MFHYFNLIYPKYYSRYSLFHALLKLLFLYNLKYPICFICKEVMIELFIFLLSLTYELRNNEQDLIAY